MTRFVKTPGLGDINGTDIKGAPHRTNMQLGKEGVTVTEDDKPMPTIDTTKSKIPQTLNLTPLTESNLEQIIEKEGGGYGVVVGEGSYIIISSERGTDIIGADQKSILKGEYIGQIPLDDLETFQGATGYAGHELRVICLESANTHKNSFNA